MKRSLSLFFLFFITSCSSYVQKMHSQIEQGHDKRYKSPQRDHFSQYRKNDPKREQMGIRNDAGKLHSISSQSERSYRPSVKRFYQPHKKRYKADDLIDNQNNGSLWTNSGQESFLFSKNNFKRNGDIIIIKVQKNLKNEISQELARAFPKRRTAPPGNNSEAPKTNSEGVASEGKKPASQTPANTQGRSADSPDKVFDRLSSVVIEEINQDHLLVRGRKDVLHRQSKRTIEIQALISRRDVADDDAVLSSTVLESNVIVLR